MKAEKMFLGSLAVVISMFAAGCAGTTPAAEYAGSLPANPGPQGVAAWAPERVAPASDSPSHITNRAGRTSLRAVSATSR
jgi:hypothetical protein